MTYDFDKIINRKNTNSLKYDCTKLFKMPENILPMWVADMDFQAPPEVIEAIKETANHGVFGYSEPDEIYFNSVQNWYKSRFSWEPDASWLIMTPGVVFAVVAAIRAFTRENDAVLIQQPVYYPFKQVILDNSRRLINSPLILQNNRYEIDFEDFENKIKNHDVKLFILCSPHNPVGRVWTKEELLKIGEICLKNNVIILCDEIHSDFIFKGHKHYVFYDLNERFLSNSIICTAPSKTFNLAGIQSANIFIADKNLRKLFKAEYDKTGYDQLNIFAIKATQAAYLYGAPWLDSLVDYLQNNVLLIDSFLKQNLPQIKLTQIEGTYLAWLNFKALNLSQKELDELIIKKANLWLSSGTIFGSEGQGFERLNFACPRPVLVQALENLRLAMKGILC